jgi:hypothetical protein
VIELSKKCDQSRTMSGTNGYREMKLKNAVPSVARIYVNELTPGLCDADDEIIYVHEWNMLEQNARQMRKEKGEIKWASA